MFRMGVVIFVLRYCHEGAGLGSQNLDTNLLFDHLFRNYSKVISPVRALSTSLNVKVEFFLYQIRDVEDGRNLITIQGFTDFEWTDNRLHWDPQDFNGLTYFYLPAHLLWLPEFELYYGQSFSEPMDAAQARLFHYGEIELSLPYLYRTPCLMNTKLFPFDKQFCKIEFGSWIYNSSDLTFSVWKEDVRLDKFYPSPNFKLLDAKQSVVNLSSNYSDSSTEEFTWFELHLHIARVPNYYIVHLVVPSMIITILCILGIFFPFQPRPRPLKFKLGITTLLSMSILLLAVAEHLPKVSIHSRSEYGMGDIPLIGAFYISLIAVIATATLISAAMTLMTKSMMASRRRKIKFKEKPPPESQKQQAKEAKCGLDEFMGKIELTIERIQMLSGMIHVESGISTSGKFDWFEQVNFVMLVIHTTFVLGAFILFLNYGWYSNV